MNGAKAVRRDPPLRGAGRFVLWFCGCLGAGHLLLALAPVERGFVRPWIALEVRLAAAGLTRGGLATHAEPGGLLVSAGGPRLDVQRGCDGLDALLILGAAILAFPARRSVKIAGLAAGALAVFLINTGRIASLMLVAVHWPARLDLFHIDVWQPLMMLLALALFLAWTLAARRRERVAG